MEQVRKLCVQRGKARTALGNASHSRAGKAGWPVRQQMGETMRGVPRCTERQTNSTREDRAGGRRALDTDGYSPPFRTFHSR